MEEHELHNTSPSMPENSAEEIRVIMDQWLEGFNEHDVEKILMLYDDNAEHYSPRLANQRPDTQGLIVGKEELRKWWQDSFDRLPTLKYEKESLEITGNIVLLKYKRMVEGEEDIMVSETFEIKGGKIIKSRVLPQEH